VSDVGNVLSLQSQVTKSSPIGYFICMNNSSVEVEAHRYIVCNAHIFACYVLVFVIPFICLIIWVRTGHGKSWNLKFKFSRPGKSWN